MCIHFFLSNCRSQFLIFFCRTDDEKRVQFLYEHCVGDIEEKKIVDSFAIFATAERCNYFLRIFHLIIQNFESISSKLLNRAFTIIFHCILLRNIRVFVAFLKKQNFISVVSGKPRVAAWLIKNGANVNCIDGVGWRPIHMSTYNGKY